MPKEFSLFSECLICDFLRVALSSFLCGVFAFSECKVEVHKSAVLNFKCILWAPDSKFESGFCNRVRKILGNRILSVRAKAVENGLVS